MSSQKQGERFIADLRIRHSSTTTFFVVLSEQEHREQIAVILAAPAPFVDDHGNPVLDSKGNPMQRPADVGMRVFVDLGLTAGLTAVPGLLNFRHGQP